MNKSSPMLVIIGLIILFGGLYIISRPDLPTDPLSPPSPQSHPNTQTPLTIDISTTMQVETGATEIVETKKESPNTVRQMTEDFLAIKGIEQLYSLMSQGFLNSYLLVTQKVLSEERVLSEEKRKEIQDHLPVFLEYYYTLLIADSASQEGMKIFRDSGHFIEYFLTEILTGKALGKDIDFAEIIAGNTDYCQLQSSFPTATDQQSCRDQVLFYHAKEAKECSLITSQDQFGWKTLCEDYFKLIP